ncbi:MAG TPA: PQQ-dependent sugar dehydrogenase [Gammaproteobacteria bacterium]|nr:PQQ-dependent sugar dehydrogenase [Gammaproteobacteria bacterium]
MQRSIALAVLLASQLVAAQEPGLPERPLPATPFVIDTAEAGPVRVTPLKGLEFPWDLAFLPNGDLLVTERSALRLRVIRNGALLSEPVTGLPDQMTNAGGGGLMAVKLHPRFADTGWVYLTYTRKADAGRRGVGLARGRLRGMKLEDVRELFTVDEPDAGPAPSLPLVFDRDGYLYFFVGGANDMIAQRGNSYYGKVLRFNDDGSVPRNPFAGRDDMKPEIYTIGHRNGIGLTVHPTTGEVWENENGPYGGDEVNILKPGANYGWPLVSYGRDYSGAPVSDKRTLQGVEDPVLFWVPSIAISGMTFYTGDRFPAWRNNLFVGGLQYGRLPHTGQMHRVVFNEKWQEVRREALFVDLRQRIRDVDQGPDGLLYVLTDERDGALLKLEPAK